VPRRLLELGFIVNPVFPAEAKLLLFGEDSFAEAGFSHP